MTIFIESPIDAARALARARGWQNQSDDWNQAGIEIDASLWLTVRLEDYGCSVWLSIKTASLPEDPALLAATIATLLSNAAATIGHGSGGA
jgi:hypothetical protein